ncbi:MAG: UxaA family hydrolase [Coprobacter sp.]|nr:UxaA family hydrolase [Coprobacter sp.]
MQNLCLKIAPDDNVAVAVKSLDAGTELEIGGRRIVLQTDVPAGQTVALIHLEAGDYIVKYGCPVGYVTECIDCGGRVNDSNTRTAVVGESGTEDSRPEMQAEIWPEDICRAYARKNGEAGVRNDIWIVSVSEELDEVAARLSGGKDKKNDMPGIDRLVSFPCPASFLDRVGTEEGAGRIWRRWISHPNAGGVLVVALKKESEKISTLKTALGKYDAKRIRFVEVKDGPSGYDLLLEQLQELMVRVSGDVPSYVPLSSLRLD